MHLNMYNLATNLEFFIDGTAETKLFSLICIGFYQARVECG